MQVGDFSGDGVLGPLRLNCSKLDSFAWRGLRKASAFGPSRQLPRG